MNVNNDLIELMANRFRRSLSYSIFDSIPMKHIFVNKLGYIVKHSNSSINILYETKFINDNKLIVINKKSTMCEDYILAYELSMLLLYQKMDFVEIEQKNNTFNEQCINCRYFISILLINSNHLYKLLKKDNYNISDLANILNVDQYILKMRLIDLGIEYDDKNVINI